jgi:hypothetical protein
MMFTSYNRMLRRLAVIALLGTGLSPSIGTADDPCATARNIGHAGAVHASSGTPAPPEGWVSLESMNMLDPEWLTHEMVEAAADFDGDGKIDHASLVISEDGSMIGLFVVLSRSGDGRTEWIKQYSRLRGEFMISVLPAGCYRIEEHRIRLRHPALWHLEFEYGFGSIHWIDNDVWRSVKVYVGGLEDVPCDASMDAS